MIPDLIQKKLQETYDLELCHQVNEFLITDRQLANTLDSSPFNRNIDEKLLVLEEQDGLNVSLFLDQGLLSNLEQNNPFENLSDNNIADFCTALEGVSHFTYLTWNATYHRTISQLELELQAEVDKFVFLTNLVGEQYATICFSEIHNVLFTGCNYDPELPEDQLMRYQTANEFAHYFCKRLESQSPRITEKLPSRELRRFYRKRHKEKLVNCLESVEIPGP